MEVGSRERGFPEVSGQARCTRTRMRGGPAEDGRRGRLTLHAHTSVCRERGCSRETYSQAEVSIVMLPSCRNNKSLHRRISPETGHRTRDITAVHCRRQATQPRVYRHAGKLHQWLVFFKSTCLRIASAAYFWNLQSDSFFRNALVKSGGGLYSYARCEEET